MQLLRDFFEVILDRFWSNFEPNFGTLFDPFFNPFRVVYGYKWTLLDPSVSSILDSFLAKVSLKVSLLICIDLSERKVVGWQR